MECYIKCPRDKNVSLAEGATSVEFSVEPPDTNYDWNKFVIRILLLLFCVEPI